MLTLGIAQARLALLSLNRIFEHWLCGVRRHLACDDELRVLLTRRRLGSLRTLIRMAACYSMPILAIR